MKKFIETIFRRFLCFFAQTVQNIKYVSAAFGCIEASFVKPTRYIYGLIMYPDWFLKKQILKKEMKFRRGRYRWKSLATFGSVPKATLYVFPFRLRYPSLPGMLRYPCEELVLCFGILTKHAFNINFASSKQKTNEIFLLCNENGVRLKFCLTFFS